MSGPTQPAPYTRDTLGTIRRNAGRMPAAQLADELGWTLHRLERVARDNAYDLKYAPDPFEAPPDPPKRAASGRNTQVTVLLYPADVDALDMVGRAFGIKRSRVVSRLIENAIARGILANLAHMPAPRLAPAAETPAEVTVP